MSHKLPIYSLYGQEYGGERAVLLINLGSPRSPRVEDVKQYLEDFLMDERVISISPFWRNILVRHIIVPRRAKYSAANYAKIWESETETFPLVRYSALIAEDLAQSLQMPIALAMRYGEPTMDEALNALVRQGIKQVKVLPLYPHYTRSSFETAVVHALTRCQALGLELELEMVLAYFDREDYRKVLADSVLPYLAKPFDKLIISMHGIPLSHLSRPCKVENGKPSRCFQTPHTPQEYATCYRLHCESTAEFLREDLGLEAQQVELVYQSRLGTHEWMKPYFATRVKEWPREGIKRVLVVSPCFVCDCLETLEEIEEEYKNIFLTSGGESFHYIPCLGNNKNFIQVLASLVSQPSIK